MIQVEMSKEIETFEYRDFSMHANVLSLVLPLEL